MIIRGITVSDSKGFLELCKTLDRETSFMMLEPDERQITIEQQNERINKMIRDGRSIILVCEINGKLVGYLSAHREKYRRVRHSAYLVVGVLEDFSGKGVGTRLFNALDQWAQSNGIHRLELTVMIHNAAAVALYKKMGFQIEGIKKHSLIVDGKYIDEYYMARLI